MSKPPKTDTWMPLFIADYQAATSRLTLAEHGAYLLLIMDYWRNGPPPSDDAVLARILAIDRREWMKLKPAVLRFFQTIDGQLRHGRIDRELADASERRSKAQQRAKAGAGARWGRGEGGKDDASSTPPSNATSMLQALPEHMLEECPPPSPSPRVVIDLSAASEKTISQQSGSDAARRGRRLNSDWQPSAENYTYAVAEGFAEAEVDRMAEDFRDFWTAKSGSDAAKLDWSATWRRWVREEAKRRRKAPLGRAAQKRVGFV